MDEPEFQRIRGAALAGQDVDPEIFRDIRDVVRKLVAYRVFPPSLAPYGQWDAESVDEIFQGWVTRRLIGNGELRPLLARSGGLGTFRSRAEKSLRHFLLNERDRSQAQNLYGRLRVLLNGGDGYRRFAAAARSQDEWWGLASWTSSRPFQQSERALSAAAWAVEGVALVRFRVDAQKLSHVLSAPDLDRFCRELLHNVDALLTIPLFLQALRERFDIDDREVVPLDVVPDPVGPTTTDADRIGFKEVAVLALEELTRRQVEVLLDTAADKTLADMSDRHGCARATVLNEQRRIGELLTRLSNDDVERSRLLNTIVDLLYEDDA